MPQYVHRAIEKELKAAIREFPVVVLTGPRQSGKSTLLLNTFPGYHYATFDDPVTRQFAANDPKAFLSQAPRMVIDEIQYLPEILPYIKMAVDEKRSVKGRFLITGSQYFPLMAGMGESLAGRAALYELLGFSTEEVWGGGKGKTVAKAFDLAFRGFYPEVAIGRVDRNRFYPSYLQTYLERDIRQIASVQDLRVFHNFLELLASRAGALLNLNEIAKECGVSFTSVRRWLSLLETTRMVYLLRPYHRNITKRVIKSPKVYFTDTGLLAYLLRYPSAAVLSRGPQAGAFFENLIVAEVLKYKLNHNLNFEMYFYRDSNHNEIDLVLDFGASRKLLEIKATSTPKSEHFAVIRRMFTELKAMKGYVVALADRRGSVGANLEVLPWADILEIMR
ncbi:ATP-binding protein [Elusimicrobiota bacterium]